MWPRSRSTHIHRHCTVCDAVLNPPTTAGLCPDHSFRRIAHGNAPKFYAPPWAVGQHPARKRPPEQS